MLGNKLVFVDVETTGGSPVYDRIIEVAALRVENGKLVDKFVTLVNPGCHLPHEITSLTGITSDMLDSAPSFRAIMTDLGEILAECIFIAHNVRFDYGFIKNEFKRQDITYKAQQFCTCKLSRMLFPRYRRHNLDSLIERHHLDCKNRHRAEGDTSAIYHFYKKTLKEFTAEKLNPVFQKILKRPSVPVNIPFGVLDNLPESPGVYIFYGKAGAPLYIGKSVNIRDRVLSHFSSDTRAVFEMKISREIKSIETVPAAGELEALITESQLVKQLLPLYNKQLRDARQMVVLKASQNLKGYKTIKIETVNNPAETGLYSIVGVFRC